MTTVPHVDAAQSTSPIISTTTESTTVPTTVLVCAPEQATEFDVLLTEHLTAYRLPAGHLVHPQSVQVLDPYATADPQVTDRKRRLGNWADLYMLGVPASGVAAGACVGIGTEPSPVFILPWMAALLAASVGCWITSSRLDTLERDSMPATMTVPADVAAAYDAYRSAPLLLRKAGAAEAAVAQVEAHLGYMDDLLVEAARLHAIGASATDEAFGVRDTMVRLAANAQTLTVLAERHRVAIAATALTTPSLLARQPDESGFKTTGAAMAEETTYVRGILDGA